MQNKEGTIAARAVVSTALKKTQPIAVKLQSGQPMDLADQQLLMASYFMLLSVVDALVAHVNAGDVRVPKDWPGIRP